MYLQGKSYEMSLLTSTQHWLIGPCTCKCVKIYTKGNTKYVGMITYLAVEKKIKC